MSIIEPPDGTRTSTPLVIEFGYGNRGSAQLLDMLMENASMRLCDVRAVPFSRTQRQWDKPVLKAAWGTRYYHFASLGNDNFRNDLPVHLHDEQAGLSQLVAALGHGFSLIIFCGCHDFEKCHRKVICDKLQVLLPDLLVRQPEEALCSQCHHLRDVEARGPLCSACLCLPVHTSPCIATPVSVSLTSIGQASLFDGGGL